MYAMLLAQNADERAVLSLVLQRAGLAVTTGYDLERAMKSWLDRPSDLIVLSLKGDLLAYIRRARAESPVPIVVVVDPPDEDIHCALLEAGADLVVARPFSARLLMAQVQALMRRAGTVPLFSLPTLSQAGLTLDSVNRTVDVAGWRSRRLTHLEFRLLYTLMSHRGQVLPSEVIVERVWGYGGRGDKDLVRGLVSRLRAKIEPEPRSPRYIRTVPGVGYAFDPDEP
ncbi:MAG TPA: response regulator transcription factor [Anaerolineae bacterium]|nr:response regulator transcription factor [Anaerolineae bacterium]